MNQGYLYKTYEEEMQKGENLENFLMNIGNHLSLEFTIAGYTQGNEGWGQIHRDYESAAYIAQQCGFPAEKINAAAKEAIMLSFLAGDIKNAERLKKSYPTVNEKDYLSCLEEAIANHNCFGGDEKIVNLLEDYQAEKMFSEQEKFQLIYSRLEMTFNPEFGIVDAINLLFLTSYIALPEKRVRGLGGDEKNYLKICEDAGLVKETHSFWQGKKYHSTDKGRKFLEFLKSKIMVLNKKVQN